MASMSAHLFALPPEIRRIIWRLIVDGVEFYQPPLGDYIHENISTLAARFISRNHLSIADDFIMAILVRRHVLIATSFGLEYLEELVSTTEVMVRCYFYESDGYDDLRRQICLRVEIIGRWTDFLKRRGLLTCFYRVGLIIKETYSETHSQDDLTRSAAGVLRTFARNIPPGRVALEIPCHVCHHLNYSYPVLTVIVDDCKKTSRSFARLIKSLEEISQELADDETCRGKTDTYSEIYHRAERRELRRDVIEGVELYANRVLEIMERLHDEDKD